MHCMRRRALWEFRSTGLSQPFWVHYYYCGRASASSNMQHSWMLYSTVYKGVVCPQCECWWETFIVRKKPFRCWIAWAGLTAALQILHLWWWVLRFPAQLNELLHNGQPYCFPPLWVSICPFKLLAWWCVTTLVASVWTFLHCVYKCQFGNGHFKLLAWEDIYSHSLHLYEYSSLYFQSSNGLRIHYHIGCICLLFRLYVSSNYQVQRMHNHISCNCLAFLHGAFSNVFSNGLYEKRQSHIGCICLAFLHCAFSNVSSNGLF